MRSVWIWMTWGAASLAGCSAEDHPDALATWQALPECPHHDYSTCDTRQPACQARLLSLAGCLYGVDSTPQVPIRVLSPEELVSELEADDEAQPQEEAGELLHIERALVALRLMQPGDISGQGSISVIVDSVAGVYLDAARGISLVDRGMAQNDADANALLLHELIHAIQDAEYDLDGWRAQQPGSVDAQLALRAVTEGQATYYQFRAILAMLGRDVERVDLATLLEGFRDSQVKEAHDNASPYLAGIVKFPYAMGAPIA